jgi:cell division protein FtsW
MSRARRAFFVIVILLASFGFFIFSSAALGLLGRDGAPYWWVAGKQFVLLLAGIVCFLMVSKINFRFWQKVAPWLLVLAVGLNILVLIPGVGLVAGGARRWLAIGPFTWQPSELLKLALVIAMAAWLAANRGRIQTWRGGVLPFVSLTAVASVLMILQPDIDTLGIMVAAGLAMFFVAGGRWRHILLIGLAGLLALGGLVLTKPYIHNRVEAFFNPNVNQLGTPYQLNQSLIAVGSGGWLGRGFGRSLQKFKYLPEPIGDSVFSVAAEEFGFAGGLALITLFAAFAWSGLKIAAYGATDFARLLAVGVVTIVVIGTFTNMAAMLGLIPLTGTPLLFVSQGGTALIFTLLEAGLVLAVARQK